MADAMWMKIRAINWADYESSHGDAKALPTILKNLSSRKAPRAMRASHQLWTALCGGGKVYSAAVPAIPLLLEIFTISDPAVQDGIIEILIRCDRYKAQEDWAKEMNFVVAQAKEDLANRRIKDEIVAAKLAEFYDNIEK